MSQKRSRRGFLKKVTYVSPLIVSLKVNPAHAANGSSCSGGGHHGGGGRRRRGSWFRSILVYLRG